MFSAGAFITQAANLIGHFLGQNAIRPSRRALPSAYKAENNPHRRKNHARKLERTRTRIGGPATKRAVQIQRLQRENTVDFLLRKQRAAWRRLGPQDTEDRIVYKAMDSLEFDRIKTAAILQQKEISDRVKAQAPQRRKAEAQRNKLARQILQAKAMVQQEQEENIIKAERARQEREVREEIAERERQEQQEMEEKERRRREEFDRLVREREEAVARAQEAKDIAERQERMKFQQQMRERRAQIAKEKAEQESKAQERENRRREAEQQRARREDRERRQREYQERERIRLESLRNDREAVGEDQLHAQLAEHFSLYNRKWEAFKTGLDTNGVPIPALSFHQIPWPTMFPNPTRVEDLTLAGVREFMFHPMRLAGTRGKPQRTIVRSEMMKWHPDKFNTVVLTKVKEQEKDLVTAGAGEIARLFNALMASL